MNEAQIEELLNEGESTSLDFKRDQYSLTNNDEKSELIKDILTFANSWRRVDAYILIGVDETKGGSRSAPVGITAHLKDSDLQQLVNSKTNRAVSFSYRAVVFKAIQLGIITIPLQGRPVFLKGNFGKLKKDVVYVRRGSSTAEASLDEILAMQAGPATPSLDLQFADIEQRKTLGNSISLFSERVEYDDAQIPLLNFSPWDSAGYTANKHYKKEMAAYIANNSLLSAVGFYINNSASTIARNVRLEITITKDKLIRVFDQYDSPRPPAHNMLGAYIPPFASPDVRVDAHGGNISITVEFGNVQPGAVAWSRDVFYIGAVEPTQLDVSGFLYGDNLPQPLPVSLKVNIDVKDRKLDPSELDA